MTSVLQVAEIAKYTEQPDSRKIGLQKGGNWSTITNDKKYGAIKRSKNKAIE